MSTSINPYRGFRFPAAIINEAVWLYHEGVTGNDGV